MKYIQPFMKIYFYMFLLKKQQLLYMISKSIITYIY